MENASVKLTNTYILQFFVRISLGARLLTPLHRAWSNVYPVAQYFSWALWQCTYPREQSRPTSHRIISSFFSLALNNCDGTTMFSPGTGVRHRLPLTGPITYLGLWFTSTKFLKILSYSHCNITHVYEHKVTITYKTSFTSTRKHSSLNIYLLTN